MPHVIIASSVMRTCWFDSSDESRKCGQGAMSTVLARHVTEQRAKGRKRKGERGSRKAKKQSVIWVEIRAATRRRCKEADRSSKHVDQRTADTAETACIASPATCWSSPLRYNTTRVTRRSGSKAFRRTMMHLHCVRRFCSPSRNTERFRLHSVSRHSWLTTHFAAAAPFIFTRDSCTGRYCWERVLATGILSVCLSVCLGCHDPVPNQAQVR